MTRCAVRIGYTPGVPSHVCSDVCAGFEERHPEYDIEFVTADRYAWVDEALAGRIDVFESTDSGWVRAEGLGFVPLFDDPLCLLVSPGDPLAERESAPVGLSDLSGRTLCVQDVRQCEGFVRRLREEAEGVEVRSMNADVADVTKRCLDGAVYLMPESYAPFYRPLLCVPLPCEEPYPVGLVFRADGGEAVEAFVGTAREMYAG